jgi:secondary thiamine-phosphate synthase enzyme
MDFSYSGQNVKSTTKYLWVNTKKRIDFIRITEDVKEFLYESEIKDGYVLVSAMHLTAAVYINDDEQGLLKDIDQWLEELAPYNNNYFHHRTGEDNGAAHLRNLIMHHQVIIPVTQGKLDLGPWQEIFYAEFDGQRNKRIIIKCFGIL